MGSAKGRELAKTWGLEEVVDPRFWYLTKFSSSCQYEVALASSTQFDKVWITSWRCSPPLLWPFCWFFCSSQTVQEQSEMSGSVSLPSYWQSWQQQNRWWVRTVLHYMVFLITSPCPFYSVFCLWNIAIYWGVCKMTSMCVHKVYRTIGARSRAGFPWPVYHTNCNKPVLF